jgi:23S rRNA (guanosine2251-2'-O)-methyltransferase
MTEVIDIIPVTNINNAIEILKKNNFWIYGMDANASTDIRSITFEPKIAFVFGSETNGIKKLVQKNCDKILKIKIKDETESLNISNAVSIALALANK